MTYIKTLLIKYLPIIKTKIVMLLGSLLTFITPIKWVFVIIFIAILLDTIYAIKVRIKVDGRKSFKSRLLRLGLSHKIFKYMGTTFLLYMIDVHIFGGALLGFNYLLSKSMAMIWVYTEMKSWDEKNQLLGRRPFIDMAKEALGFYKGVKKEIDDLNEK
jgi:hypothetical protein